MAASISASFSARNSAPLTPRGTRIGAQKRMAKIIPKRPGPADACFIAGIKASTKTVSNLFSCYVIGRTRKFPLDREAERYRFGSGQGSSPEKTHASTTSQQMGFNYRCLDRL